MIRRILAVGVVAVLAGCAHDHFDGSHNKMAYNNPSPSEGMASAGGAGAMCPAKIPNTTVQVRDVQNGVAMEFVTSGNVSDLRSSVHGMAQHEQQVASAGGTYGANAQGSTSSGSTSGSYGSNESYGSNSTGSSGSSESGSTGSMGGSSGSMGGSESGESTEGGQVRTSNPESGASGSSGSAASSGEGAECDTGTGSSSSTGAGAGMGSSSGTASATPAPAPGSNCTSAGCGAFGVPVNAQVQDIKGGSQLVLQPVDASQLDTLRANAQTVGSMMQNGQCPQSGAANPG